MKLLIIQISDLHIKDVGGSISGRLRFVAKAVKHVASDVTTVVVVLSGDVAFSGQKKEYEVAGAYFKTLLADITMELGSVPVHLIGVPGNHDCDFGHPSAATRKLLLEGLSRSSKEKADENTLGICCQIQSDFFNFLDGQQTLKPVFSKTRAYYDFLIPVGSEQVLFRCFNTAFSSTLPEVAGQMIYPLSLLQVRTIEPTPTYSVAIFHHPYNWLTPTIKREFSEHIETNCDLIFTGHEHATAYYKKEAFSGLVTNYIEGAVFQEHGTDVCGFNVALINLATAQEKIHSFRWNEDHFAEDEITNGWQPFRRSKSRREFELEDAMTDRLQDPGATFTHPAKPQLLLEDIYVPPNAQELTFKDGKDLVNKGKVDSKDILNFISNKHRVMVIGRERSGKSTLAKVLFRQFYGKGLIPILINGEEIRGTDVEKFDELVESRLRQDYKNPLLDKFRQLPDDRVVVIVDDFDHAKLNARGRLKFLDGIHKKFDRLVIFGDDILRFEQMACGELGPKVLSEYTQIELMEYGHVLRSAIVDKWYDVNREYIANAEELERKVARAEKLIDEILGRSYLPSYPIFILTILQGFDTAEPISNSAGSYGYLYSVLITKRLAKGDKELTLDKKLAYLVELGFHMFKSGRKELSAPEFDLFHKRHCAEYLPIDQKLIIKELESAGIIELFHDHYRFKYNYFYYYFVAQYFSRHIEEESVKTCIANLCEQLEKEDSANIWMFLTNQSRSNFLLDTILNHATKFFSSIAPPRFEEDVQFLVKLYDLVPELVYVPKTTEELRQERRKNLDDHSSSANDQANETEETNDALRTLAKLKAALRTLEVMGQIVKNYAGSMRNEPKYQLVKQCYELGLRVVGVIFDVWQKAGEGFVQEVLDAVLLKEENIKTKEELEKLMKKFIFFFCETTSFSIIKRISHAVGTKDLNDIYEKVLTENPNNAYRLLDLSVKLDSVGVPTGEIFDLHDKFKDNVFCGRLLSHLVIHHFYLFNTNEQTKQRICDKLGIKIHMLRGIDASTASQKQLPKKSNG